jgi:tRNA threonylcarbamoyladenosine biosynthesis protein TsaB
VALDARMQEVYGADFRVDAGQPVRLEGRERVVPPGDLVAGQEGPFIAVGNGFERYPELVECADEGAVHRFEAIWPRAAVVAQLALDYLRRHPPLPAIQAQPVYLRDRVAEKPKAR